MKDYIVRNGEKFHLNGQDVSLVNRSRMLAMVKLQDGSIRCIRKKFVPFLWNKISNEERSIIEFNYRRKETPRKESK